MRATFWVKNIAYPANSVRVWNALCYQSKNKYAAKCTYQNIYFFSVSNHCKYIIISGQHNAYTWWSFIIFGSNWVPKAR